MQLNFDASAMSFCGRRGGAACVRPGSALSECSQGLSVCFRHINSIRSCLLNPPSRAAVKERLATKGGGYLYRCVFLSFIMIACHTRCYCLSRQLRPLICNYLEADARAAQFVMIGVRAKFIRQKVYGDKWTARFLAQEKNLSCTYHITQCERSNLTNAYI